MADSCANNDLCAPISLDGTVTVPDEAVLLSIPAAARALGYEDASAFRGKLKDPEFPLAVFLELDPTNPRPSRRQARLRLSDVRAYQRQLREEYRRLRRKGLRA